MDAEGINHHEDDSHERREQDVDGGGDELLDVSSDLLQLTERFSTTLIFKDGIGQLEGMADAVGVKLSAESLCDDVDVVVLKILRHARHEGHAHCRSE